MKKPISLLILISLSMLATSCASNAKNQIQEKIENVSINNEKDLQIEVRKSINDSKALTLDQKEKLLALDEEYITNQKAMKEEITKAKVVLLEIISRKELNKKELKAVKNKIVELNKKRVNDGFKTVDQIRGIIFPKQAKTTNLTQEEKDAAYEKQREMYYMIYRHKLNEL